MKKIVACLALLLVGCVSSVTVEDEQRVGADVARQVETQIGLYNAEYLGNWVDAVGRRLVAELGPTPYLFRFRIIDQAEPNAFATPGGYIFISRGLLALINDENELAGILAHEISHVTLRHHARQASRSVLPGLLTLPGRAVGAVVGEDVGNMINSPIEAAGRVYLSAYSRGQETEADMTGMQLAARAGYDPAALGAALSNLDRSVQLITGIETEFSYYDSHPMTPDRVANIEAEAVRIQWRPAPPFAERQAVLKRLDGLWWGPDNPMQGIFRGSRFLQSDLDFTLNFPDGWRTVNTPGFVGAFEPSQQALAIIGGVGAPRPPEEFADAFIAEIEHEAGIKPAEYRSLQIGEWPARLVRFDDASGAEPVSLYYLWVTSPRLTFQLIGFGARQYRDALRETALSLRPLTDEERASITGERLRLAKQQAGEDFETFAMRTGDILSRQLTLAINGLPEDYLPDPERTLKIVVTERYR